MITFGQRRLGADVWELAAGFEAMVELATIASRADGSPWGEQVLCAASAVVRQAASSPLMPLLCRRSSLRGVRDATSMEMALVIRLAVAHDQWMPVAGCRVLEVGRQWT